MTEELLHTRQVFVLHIRPSGIDRVEDALGANELIIGWSKATGLLDKHLSQEEFRQIIHDTYHSDDPNHRGAGAATGNMRRFIREMQVGDLVLVPHGSEFYVASVSGPAYHDEAKVQEDTAYRRPATWLNNKKPVPRHLAPPRLLSRMRARLTCVCASDLIEEVNDVLTLLGARNQQTARAGEYYVAAELNRRGAYAVTFAGNMPGIDVMASNLDRSRTVHIQVKTKRRGTWHTSTDQGEPREEPDSPETTFWIFVDIGDTKEHPEFWMVPDWWMRNDIYEAQQAYLAEHGGKRPRSPKSKHHGIDERRIKQWKDRWEILGVF